VCVCVQNVIRGKYSSGLLQKSATNSCKIEPQAISTSRFLLFFSLCLSPGQLLSVSADCWPISMPIRVGHKSFGVVEWKRKQQPRKDVEWLACEIILLQSVEFRLVYLSSLPSCILGILICDSWRYKSALPFVLLLLIGLLKFEIVFFNFLRFLTLRFWHSENKNNLVLRKNL